MTKAQLRELLLEVYNYLDEEIGEPITQHSETLKNKVGNAVDSLPIPELPADNSPQRAKVAGFIFNR